MAVSVPEFLSIWSDGSQDSVDHVDVEIVCSGALTTFPDWAFEYRSWKHALDGIDDGCSNMFASVPGPLQAVQRVWREVIRSDSQTYPVQYLRESSVV